MTTFTTVPRVKVNWEAPVDVAVSENYKLNIGGGFYLNIGSGFNLLIQPGRAGTTWTNINKTR